MSTAPLYFRRLGRTMLLLGLGYLAASVIAVAFGWFDLWWVSVAPPLVTTGGAMWLVPGDARSPPDEAISAGWERCWTGSGAGIKLIWLAAFVVGVLGMLAGLFFLLAPASAG